MTSLTPNRIVSDDPQGSEHDELSYEPLPAEPVVLNQQPDTDSNRQLPVIEL